MASPDVVLVANHSCLPPTIRIVIGLATAAGTHVFHLSIFTEVCMKLYVGNLSRDVTEDDLRGAFQPFGTLDSVSIIKDRSNNVSKGFGFVEMSVKAEAEAAIAGLHGKEFMGRSMDVNEARPRPEHGRSGGGGGRGGYKGGGGGGGRRW